jgi:hypothetical protein
MVDTTTKEKDVSLKIAVDNTTVNPSEVLQQFALPVSKDGKLGTQPVIIVDPTTGKAFGAANPFPIVLT